MRRGLAVAAGVVVLAVGIGAIRVYQWINDLDYERVVEDVHVIRTSGIGGNVGVLATDAGAVIVDTMTFRRQGARIRELAERLAGGPTQAVINTHYHADHTHGNPGFAAGTRIVATQRTLDYLVAFDAESWQGAAAGTLPNELFEGARHELRVGGKTIRAHHLGHGHTGGDLVVQFVEDGVLHTGDLVFNGRYPNIDLEAGGSIPAWIATLDRVLELDFERVIPGHGPVTDRDGIRAFQDFLRELWEIGQESAREGLSLQQALEVADLTRDADFEVVSVPFVFRLDRDFVVRRAWEEATGAVRPAQAPRAEAVEEGS